MIRDSKAVRKYLAAHAAPEAALARALPRRYANVIVVPVRDESPAFLDGFRPAAPQSDDLVVVVVNGASDSPEAVHAANAALWRDLAGRGQVSALGEGVLLVRGADRHLLLVERSSAPRRLAAGEGVGTARKIGCDLALAAIVEDKIHSHWVHTSDADAEQPADRFRIVPELRDPDTVALTFPYTHVPSGDAALDEATRLYEVWLRYWRRGLDWAGSPFAFQAIGSTLALRGDAYAKVRGFPRRAAGEDFYVLNKLAKIGRIRVPSGVGKIRIAVRASNRVPFGTGPGVARVQRDLAGGKEFRLENPRAFALLGTWLQCLREFARTGDPANLRGAGGNRGETSLIESALQDLGAPAALIRQREQHASAPDSERPLHAWFDGLRTLKFLHAVRDRGVSDLSWRTALKEAPFVAADGSESGDELLRILEERGP